MARTNVEVELELLLRVRQRYGLSSDSATIDFALRKLAPEQPMSPSEALAMEGSGWEGDLAALRGSRSEVI